MLVLVCGLPLTGKTYFAKALSKKLKAIHLNTDAIRKKLLRKPSYTEREKLFVYNHLFKQLDSIARKKNAKVIVDGTFYKKSLRDKIKRIALKNNQKLVVIELIASLKTIKKHFLHKKRFTNESNADLNTFFLIKKQFQPIKERHLRINSAFPLSKQLKLALAFIKKGV